MNVMFVNIGRAKCFHIVSLGCPKNLTDSEVLMGHMREAGYEYTDDPASADVIIVNTCAFLSSARKESLDVIKEMAQYKKKGKCGQLLVAGCLPKYVRAGRDRPLPHSIDGVIDSIALHDCHAPRIKATPPWTAYVKISEGCNNNCAYCLIPSIRGRLRNRKTSDVLKEVRALAGRGVKEVIFVAQDTTAHPKFPEILKKAAKIKGVRWLRIMYTHPKHITDKLVDVMAKERKILEYIDLPMQHSSNRILKMMSRGYDRKHLETLIAKLRKKMPSIAIRTTFIVGFPGETEKDFEDLMDFVKTMKFDRVGVFPYSREKGTRAYKMKGQVSERVKSERVRKLMKIQERISRDKNRGFIGKTMDILVEGAGFGRTYRDAPEIDGRVEVVSSKEQGVRVGDIVKVLVTKAETHDLEGANLDGASP
jgi:ribosomal protein S12 methylthiotransferase